jgi:hypothetical protein
MANWTYSSGSGPLANGDSLVFNTAGSTSPNNNETNFTFPSTTFNSGANADTIGGSAFTLGTRSLEVERIVNITFNLGEGWDSCFGVSGQIFDAGVIPEAPAFLFTC